MTIPDALSAIRKLDALPDARRRHLSMLAADAPRDSDRARIVLEARHEAREARAQTEATLKADYRARTEWALRNPQRLAEARQEPSRRRFVMDDEVRTPAPRPVTTRWTTPTKIATAPTKRPEKIGANHRERVAEPLPPGTLKVNPNTGRPVNHGKTSGYQAGCRCEACKSAKAASRKGQGRKRRAAGEPAPCGSTTQYSRGCRCELCRDAVATYARKKRAEKQSGKSSS